MGARGAAARQDDDHRVDQRVRRRCAAAAPAGDRRTARQPDPDSVRRDRGGRRDRQRRRARLDDALHQIVKPPPPGRARRPKKLFDAATLTKALVFYEGSARQAAGDYPQNANATVVTSLAGIGIDRTRVQLIVDPAARINEHRIKVRGAFGELEIVLRNNPLATNPKSSELTALSLVRLIEQQGRAVVI